MKKSLVVLSILFFLISIFFIFTYFYIKDFYNIDISNNIKVLNSKGKDITLEISNLKNTQKCGYKTDGVFYWFNVNNNKCILKTENNLKKIYVKKNVFIRGFTINDLVIGDNLPKKVFLALNDEMVLNPNVDIIGKKRAIRYISLNNKIVTIKNNKLIAKEKGTVNVKMIVNNKYTKEMEVEVTDLIVKRPKKYNKNKKNLKCNRYSKNDAKKLDEILNSRIESVGGYGTRAAVVESIRFLLLDFPYQIEYFFENGRIDGGMHNSDGEGRYYHKGLYLDESKFKSLKYSYAGPAIWGCPLKNFENYGTVFRKGEYKPNGLDCSGFVSWSILNGGFDVGDKGAGDNLEDTNEINDIGGVKADTSVELFKSGKVKAGDLLGIWGHIAIVAGIDDNNVYVAESLWTYGGPVINTYTFEEATDEFVQAVLLDDLYKKDGLYTSMW